MVITMSDGNQLPVRCVSRAMNLPRVASESAAIRAHHPEVAPHGDSSIART
jgi:hypothetical protein